MILLENPPHLKMEKKCLIFGLVEKEKEIKKKKNIF